MHPGDSLTCDEESARRPREALDRSKEGLVCTEMTHSVDTSWGSLGNSPIKFSNTDDAHRGRPAPPKLQAPVVVVIHGLPPTSSINHLNQSITALRE